VLVVPHPRWQERGFVQAPLADLWPQGSPEGGSSGGGGGSSAEGGGGEGGCRGGLEGRLLLARQLWEAAGGGSATLL
jgi:hypothetical protein